MLTKVENKFAKILKVITRAVVVSGYDRRVPIASQSYCSYVNTLQTYVSEHHSLIKFISCSTMSNALLGTQ